jgi:hypothetical protein
MCSHFTSVGGHDGYCDIYNKLLSLPEHHFIWASAVINCAAYDKVEKMNIINSLDEMVAFIEQTGNFFGCPEAYEEYYGFERNWNEETGEILETVQEYYNRGGVFENIPTEYPCVIRFDYGDRNGLEWIYIGK